MPKSRSSSKQPSTKRPSHHTNNTKSGFKNPWPSAEAPTWNELLQLSFPFSLYPGKFHHHKEAHEVKVVKQIGENQKPGVEKEDCVIATWLGHAGALAEFPPLASPSTSTSPEELKSTFFLFDPIFSSTAGPTQFIGPGRLKQSPCKVVDLPGCDAVFISHNHYDHLDLSTITNVLKYFPDTTWFVPLGNKNWFTSSGIKAEKIVELDWWEDWDGNFQSPSRSKRDNPESFKVTSVPTQHTSGRSGLDKDSTLWCGWVIERFTSSNNTPDPPKRTRKGAIYHAGDTGYRRTARSPEICPAFTEIGSKFGPFDLSFIPIWRGGTLGFISYVGLRLSHHDIPSALHCSPTEAISIHLDVKSRNTIGVHFGTFIGSENESHDALIELCEARSHEGVGKLGDEDVGEKGRAGTLDIGASLSVVLE